MNTFSKIQETLQNKINRAGEYWLEKLPAEMGNHSGVVEVPDTENMVYVRLSNGQVIQVFNDKAPNIYNWKVYVGRDKSQPWLMKILEVRWVYNVAQSVAYVVFHHTQHEYPAPDTVWVRRDQFMPLLVLPNGGFNVRLFGDVIYSQDMTNPVRVADADIDLSSHTILTGAKYVLMEVDATGALNYVTGATATSRGLLQTQPMPVPTTGSIPIALFEFFEGQTELRRDSTERTIIDLRMFTSGTTTPINVGDEIHAAAVDTLSDSDEMGFWEDTSTILKKITWANVKATLKTYFDTLYATIAHTHSYTYTDISTNDPDTDVTGAELEDLTDGGATTLHTHAGGSGHVIQEEGTPLTSRSNLNFVGSTIAATDDAANDATKVTVNPFNDAEGNPADVGLIAQDGTSNYAARRDHVHAISGAEYPPLHFTGYRMANNGTDPNNDIDLSPGKCRDAGNATNIILGSTLTKQLDASWVVGNNQGGLFSGSKASNTWYHFFVIMNTLSSVVDAGFDTSMIAANRPAGYENYRLISSVKTDGSGNILGFYNYGNIFMWKSPTRDLSAGAAGTATLFTVSVPTGRKVRVMGNAIAVRGTVAAGTYIYDPDQPYSNASGFYIAAYAPNVAGMTGIAYFECLTNTSAQLYYYVLQYGGSGSVGFWDTGGWEELRQL